MKGSTKVSVIVNKLLVEGSMDGFSIIELRNAYLLASESKLDPDEARKKIYRQVLRFVRNSWLASSGRGREKRYFQTELFKSLHERQDSMAIEVESSSKPDYSVLRHECNQYRAELELALGEVEEYQSLNRRFPELESRLSPLLEQTRERSAHLLGKVNVLTSVLKTLFEDTAKC